LQATGVPLLDVLMRLKTMDAAIAHCTQLAGTAVAIAVLGSLLLYVVDRMAGKRISAGGSGFNAPLAALCSAFKPAKARRRAGARPGCCRAAADRQAGACSAQHPPAPACPTTPAVPSVPLRTARMPACAAHPVPASASTAFRSPWQIAPQVLLPWYAATYVTTVGAALAQVAATRLKKDFAALCGSRQEQILGWLRHFTQLTQVTACGLGWAAGRALGWGPLWRRIASTALNAPPSSACACSGARLSIYATHAVTRNSGALAPASQDISELLIIVFVAWALIDFKNRCLGWLATAILSDTCAAPAALCPCPLRPCRPCRPPSLPAAPLHLLPQHPAAPPALPLSVPCFSTRPSCLSQPSAAPRLC
jgi:hypothetical protein